MIVLVLLSLYTFSRIPTSPTIFLLRTIKILTTFERKLIYPRTESLFRFTLYAPVCVLSPRLVVVVQCVCLCTYLPICFLSSHFCVLSLPTSRSQLSSLHCGFQLKYTLVFILVRTESLANQVRKFRFHSISLVLSSICLTC